MRKLTVFLSFLLIFGVPGLPGWGKPAGFAALDKQVERQVLQAPAKAQSATKTKGARPAAKPQNDGLTPRQQQITAALDKVRLKADDPELEDHVLSFEEFKFNNRILTFKYQRRLEILNQLQQEIEDIKAQIVAKIAGQRTEELEAAAGKMYTVEREQPDYGKETKGVPFIYLSEASGHSTQSIANEVQAVMRSVRAANPQARILLATEFAVMGDCATPIQFAGKTNKDMYISEPYDKLVPQANQLGIDVLALDDFIVWSEIEEEEDYTGWKVGNRLLLIPLPYEKVIGKQWDEIAGSVDMSTLGIKLRNEQWASYIRAVKPFYDIVIVYGGNAHLNNPDLPELDVPVQLAGKHVIFDFYTLEQNQEEDDFANNTYKMLCDEDACVKVPAEEPQEKIDTAEETAEEWDGKSYIYEKEDTQAFEKFKTLLPAEIQAQHDAVFEKFLKAGFKDIDPEAQFNVYVPDITQAAGK